MHARAKGKPVEQVVAAIQALDLEPIKFKLMDPEEGQGWSRQHADRMETEYKRFLTLFVTHPEETLAPSKDVDKFWHGHILDTLKYAKDCEKVFGYFLHHFPYFGMRGSEDAANQARAAEATRRLYQEEFGGAERAAYCGAIRQDGAAYCGAIKSGEPAYCGAIRAESAAYCGAIGQDEAAYCGAIKSGEPAYCGVIRAESAAYCGAIGQDEAAYCGAIRAEKAAYCGAIRAESTAYCGAVKRDEPAYCGAIKAEKPAYCGAIKEEGPVRGQTAHASDKLNVSVRPGL